MNKIISYRANISQFFARAAMDCVGNVNTFLDYSDKLNLFKAFVSSDHLLDNEATSRLFLDLAQRQTQTDYVSPQTKLYCAQALDILKRNLTQWAELPSFSKREIERTVFRDTSLVYEIINAKQNNFVNLVNHNVYSINIGFVRYNGEFIGYKASISSCGGMVGC